MAGLTKSRRPLVAAPSDACYTSLFPAGDAGADLARFDRTLIWDGGLPEIRFLFPLFFPSCGGCCLKERRTGQLRRQQDRVRKRLVVRFGTDELVHSGYTRDISGGGIFIQSAVVHPPGTVLCLQIDYPEGPVTQEGVVRWCKTVPAPLKRSLKGGMGVEFSGTGSQGPRLKSPASSPTPTSRSGAAGGGPPPEVSDRELAQGTTERRQVSTMAGNTFEILQTEYRGAFYVRAYQLPRTDGSQEAILEQAFWSRDEAALAIRAFLKSY